MSLTRRRFLAASTAASLRAAPARRPNVAHDRHAALAHHLQDYLLAADTAGPGSPRCIQGLPTYTEFLAESGHTVGMCGKWHMGGHEAAQAGFTYWATVPGAAGPTARSAFTFVLPHQNPAVLRSLQFK